jgi:probable glucitol transport protein GutA
MADTTQAKTEEGGGSTLNQAKLYQLILFPFNNGATNVYYVLLMNYIAYYANGVLGLVLAFATTMVTVTRALDAFIDPVVGMMIDRTETKFGKFRPFMVLGNVVMIVSSLLIFYGTRLIPADATAAKYVVYTLFYILLMVGYSIQTSCTRAGQTCLTNDPKQRPTFTLFNTVASLVGMGVTMAVASIVGGNVGFGTEAFFNFLIPLVIILSAALTALAVIGIAGKDKKEYWGLGGKDDDAEANKLGIKDYVQIFKANKELQRLMVAASGTKFAFAVATNTSVGILLYSCMMHNYNGLYLPMYVMGYVFSAPFFIGGLKISQKHGQKKTLVTFTSLALVLYLGVCALLAMWDPNNAAMNLSIFSTEGGFHLTLNAYTIIFIVLYGLGYGAYYSTADMAIPMIADCSDYEMYRSGNYAPGVIGTLFSFVDKLVSSLSTTVVGIALLAVGLTELPDTTTAYASGMNWLTIVLFCIIPMIAWVLTLVAMKGYTLTGDRMKEIQAVNACRKDAIAGGMSVEAALSTYETMDQVPEKYRA